MTARTEGKRAPLSEMSEMDLATEAVRAADRLDACAEEYHRRGRNYAASVLASLARRAEELVASETAWRKVQNGQG